MARDSIDRTVNFKETEKSNEILMSHVSDLECKVEILQKQLDDTHLENEILQAQVDELEFNNSEKVDFMTSSGTVKKILGAGCKSPHSNRLRIWLLRAIL